MSEVQNDLECTDRYLTVSESEKLYSEGIRHIKHANVYNKPIDLYD